MRKKTGKKTDYIWKLIDEDHFTITYFIDAKSYMFNLFWKKAIRKMQKQKVEIEESFKDKIDAINLKAVPLPSSLKTLVEGKMRGENKKLLEKYAEKYNLVFYTAWLDDAIYRKQENGDWKIEMIFKGEYARKIEDE